MRKPLVSTLLAVAALSLLAAPALAGPPAHASVNQQLAEVRQATARYHDVAAAVADGYLPPVPEDLTAGCVPAMGFHYVRTVAGIPPGAPGDFPATSLDPAAPEILVYAPKPNGELRLVAVEYASWQPASLFGQTFAPPAPEGQGPPFHTLHAWVWQGNPDGVFAAHNPNVSCG